MTRSPEAWVDDVSFDAPTSRDDRQLQQALRAELAGNGPDLAARLAAAPRAAREAARVRVDQLRPRRRPSPMWRHAAVVLLGVGAVTYPLLVEQPDSTPAHENALDDTNHQDPSPRRVEPSRRFETKRWPEMLRRLDAVRGIGVQLSRSRHEPNSSRSWITPVPGVRVSLDDDARQAILTAVRQSTRNDGRIRVFDTLGTLEFDLGDGTRFDVAAFPGDEGITVLVFDNAGQIQVPSTTGGLDRVFATLDERATRIWAEVQTADALAATPATLRELTCHGLNEPLVAAALRRLPNLSRLHLHSAFVSPELVRAVSQLEQLEVLTLRAPPVEEPREEIVDLATLTAAPRLRRLELANQQVDPRHLVQLAHLRDLALEHCLVDAPGFSLLAALPVTRLSLRHSLPRDAEQVRSLALLANLRELDLASRQVDETLAAVEALAKLPQLRRVTLDAPRESLILDALCELRQLERLDVSATRLRPDAVEVLRGALGDVVVISDR